MAFDLNARQFPTSELLHCVRGLSSTTFRQRVHQGALALSSSEESAQGRETLHSGRDVIQTALHHELARLLGPLARNFEPVWRVVDHRLDKIEHGDKSTEKAAALFHLDADGYVKMLLVDEAKFRLANYEKILGEDDEAPLVSGVVRVDRLIEEMIRAMEVIIETRADYEPPGPDFKPGRKTQAMAIDKSVSAPAYRKR